MRGYSQVCCVLPRATTQSHIFLWVVGLETDLSVICSYSWKLLHRDFSLLRKQSVEYTEKQQRLLKTSGRRVMCRIRQETGVTLRHDHEQVTDMQAFSKCDTWQSTSYHLTTENEQDCLSHLFGIFRKRLSHFCHTLSPHKHCEEVRQRKYTKPMTENMHTCKATKHTKDIIIM